jgi:hypothetical protein
LAVADFVAWVDLLVEVGFVAGVDFMCSVCLVVAARRLAAVDAVRWLVVDRVIVGRCFSR